MTNRNFKILIKAMIYGALFQMFFSVLLVDWLPLQNFGYGFYELTLKILPMFLAIALCALFLFAAIFSKKARSKIIILLGFTTGIFIMTSPSNIIGHKLRTHEFEKLADRSDELISAINSYKKTNGEFPNDLAQLIPKYLDKYPSTNMAAYPNYSYSKTENGKGFTLVVECGRGILNWDEFIYKSDEDYSDFSESAEKVKRWIYFHE